MIVCMKRLPRFKLFRTHFWSGMLLPLLLSLFAMNVAQAEEKPNILIIWGDDVGWFNTSAYNRGMMGYRTPNIDSIASEGGLFTDWYGQQSCTAGRAAFITGQSPFRTGLLKVGLPGAKEGISEKDPTLAGLLKNHGYMTAQYGKNHLGDLDSHLPTNHGFDEFFGNLYHLNAEEEPESPDYPKGAAFAKKFGPRGVIMSSADGTIEDTGPLSRKRMETVDEEVTAGAINFMERAVKADKPFFLWWNSTRMHVNTHLKPESDGVTGLGIYADGMAEHDKHVGELLAKVDALGIEGNTIIMYSTDNGAEMFTWPDGGMSPFRNEKNTNWEGGYRVPTMIKWPGVIKPGTVYNDVFSHEDMLPTLLAAAGEPDVKEKLLKGHSAIGRNYKVHLDGYNLMPYFSGEVETGPRQEFFYWTDDGQLANLRYGRWKMVFMEQRAHGFNVWQDPMVVLRLPKLFDLRGDPFERADVEAAPYDMWRFDRAYLILPAVNYVAEHLATYQEFPPRQEAGSFNLNKVLETLQSNSVSN
ncbi:Arylsulfatase [Halioglobus japonicus]|nr:Arylsulfatase [Halioglobus japonicus]